MENVIHSSCSNIADCEIDVLVITWGLSDVEVDDQEPAELPSVRLSIDEVLIMHFLSKTISLNLYHLRYMLPTCHDLL